MLIPSFEIFCLVISYFLLKIKILPVSQSFSSELFLSIKNDVMTSVMFCFEKKNPHKHHHLYRPESWEEVKHNICFLYVDTFSPQTLDLCDYYY